MERWGDSDFTQEKGKSKKSKSPCQIGSWLLHGKTLLAALLWNDDQKGFGFLRSALEPPPSPSPRCLTWASDTGAPSPISSATKILGGLAALHVSAPLKNAPSNWSVGWFAAYREYALFPPILEWGKQ